MLKTLTGYVDDVDYVCLGNDDDKTVPRGLEINFGHSNDMIRSLNDSVIHVINVGWNMKPDETK